MPNQQAATRKPAQTGSSAGGGTAVTVAGNTSSTQPENRTVYPALDGLRAIAFLLVFFQHYKALPWGWTGVNIFFVLSGFLITGILWDTRDDTHRVWNFYIRRTLRIFPLYWGVFLLLLLIAPFFHWRWTAGWWAWPLYAGNYLRFLSPETMVMGSVAERLGDAQLQSARLPDVMLYLGHFWSLCVEEQFYLLWPSVVFFTRSRRALLWICGITVVIVPLGRVLAQATAAPWLLGRELLNRALPFQMDALLLGGLLALLWRGPLRVRLIQGSRVLAPLGLVLALVYVALTLPPDLNLRTYAYPVWRLTWGQEYVNILSGALIVVCAASAGPLFHALHWRPLRWLGRLSYGAYVFHDIPHKLYIPYALKLFPDGGNAVEWTVTGMGLVGSVLLAYLSFRFFESPFLDLKERLTRRTTA